MILQEQWSCQQFQDATHKTYFISIAHRAAPGEEGSADLALTDGSQAWTAQGVTSDHIKGGNPARLKHLLAALSELEQPEVHYSTEVAPQSDGTLSLRVVWKQPSTGLKVFITATLAAAVPAAPVVASMLELLLGNLTALKTTCQDLLQQSKAFEQQAARSQDIVDKYVKTKEQHDKETNVKVAALLNSKKKKLRELKAQLDAAQEEIKRLQEHGPEAMDAEADDEVADAAGTSNQHAASKRGRAKVARVVADSTDEKDNSSVEDTDEERDYSDQAGEM